MRFPPLPSEIHGLAGPIKIDRPLVVDPKNPKNIGLWLGDERRILIKATLGREPAWLTLLHELGHASLQEAGIMDLSYRREEQIVDAIASGMLHVVRLLVNRG